jgi:hypothetical protein
VRRGNWFPIAVIAVATLGSLSTLIYGQAVPQNEAAEMIHRAATIHIPLMAIQREPLGPASGLTESDLSLTIDGQSRTFQLSRPWSEDINPKTGQPQDRPNLLIILPLGVPLNRGELLDKTIADLSQQPELDWNISILDDSGNQTPYVRGLKTAIAELKTISAEKPGEVDLAGWRTTAALAIASMRDLPGRRVVLTLGDIFHEVVVQRGELMYEAFQIDDVETAARNSGAVVYACESTDEVERLRGLAPYYSLVGAGPWLLLTKDDHPAGWFTGSIGETIDTIRHTGMGAYQIDLHLDAKQMDGELHAVSVTPHAAQIILDAPAYYVAPRLARLRQLAALSPPLRQALKVTPAAGSSPLEMVTQLAYFPHPDGKTGTQIATTGFFWNKAGPPPAKLDAALELEQTSSGLVLNTTVGELQWSSNLPVWNTAMDVGPGAYMLRVAAADASAKIVAGVNTSFTVEPVADDAVMISSVALGKSCVFIAESPVPNSVDYLRAGNCELRPDPTHQYSPLDVVWSLVRITPTGKLAGRQSKDWKASFMLVDANGSKLAEMPVRWLTAEDGSYVATTAFPLENPKLKLVDGEYAIVFRLKGPGIERDYGEDASFAVHGAAQAPPEKH